MRRRSKAYIPAAAVAALFLSVAASAQGEFRAFPDIDPATIIRPPPGYLIWSHSVTRDGSHTFSTSSGSVTREGVVRRIEFRPVDGAAALPPAEILDEQGRSLEEAGAVLVGRDDDAATYRLDHAGAETWVEILLTRKGYLCTIVEEARVPPPDAYEPGEGPTLQPPSLSIEPGLPEARPHGSMAVMDRPELRPPLVTYFVSAGSDPGGTGSEGEPFGTIGEAIQAAGAIGALRVRVELAPGEYEEDVTLDRGTEIAGAGGVPRILGTVDGAGLDLALESVEIRSAPGTAVRQEGGTLEMTGCRIVGTVREPGDPASGRGLRLSGGAEASVTGCVFRSNEGQAILLTGEGTRATCSDISANYNLVHPSAAGAAMSDEGIAGTGCIEAAGGAKLQMEEFSLSGNEFFGVLVHSGATAHLRNGRIDGTKLIERYGGANLGVFEGCSIELRHFVTAGAGLLGIRMIGSHLRAIDIEFVSNPIAFSYHQPPGDGYDPMACLTAYPGNLRMEDNGLNFDLGSAVTVPDPADILGEDDADGAGEEAPEPWCPEVPWE